MRSLGAKCLEAPPPRLYRQRASKEHDARAAMAIYMEEVVMEACGTDPAPVRSIEVTLTTRLILHSNDPFHGLAA